MKEGEPVLGGPQVSPGNVQPTNPGVQPAGFETLQNTQNTQPTPLTPPPSPTFTPNALLSGAQLNNPTPQPAPVSPPAPAQSQFFTQPTAPNMGDVVLSDTPPQKPKKGLTIGIVLVVLILIIGGSALLFINTQNNGTKVIDNNLIKDSFNQYANYVLWEKDSTEQVEDFTIDDEFAIDEKNTDSIFLETCRSLFAIFAKDFVKSDFIRKTNAPLYVTDEYYDFLIQKNNLTPLSKEELFKFYATEGVDAAIIYLEDYYANVDQSNYLMKTLVSYYKEYAKYLIEEWVIYDNAGCRENDIYNILCMENVSSETIDNASNILGNIEVSMNNLTTQSLENIKEQIWQYRMAIYEENYDVSEYNYSENGDVDDEDE